MQNGSSATPYRLESVKVCGITNKADRDLVADAGADFFGVLVDVGWSPRSLTLAQAKSLFDSPPIPGVALIQNSNPAAARNVVKELSPFAIQLVGKDSPESVAELKSALDCLVWKSLFVPPRGRGQIDMEEMETLVEDYEDSGADIISIGTGDLTGGSARHGGTGMVGDWPTIRMLMRTISVPGFLAGGLDPSNVVSAVQTVRPNGIDLCSGVEASVGKKDARKLTALFAALAPLRQGDGAVSPG